MKCCYQCGKKTKGYAVCKCSDEDKTKYVYCEECFNDVTDNLNVGKILKMVDSELYEVFLNLANEIAKAVVTDESETTFKEVIDDFFETLSKMDTVAFIEGALKEME